MGSVLCSREQAGGGRLGRDGMSVRRPQLCLHGAGSVPAQGRQRPGLVSGMFSHLPSARSESSDAPENAVPSYTQTGRLYPMLMDTMCETEASSLDRGKWTGAGGARPPVPRAFCLGLNMGCA